MSVNATLSAVELRELIDSGKDELALLDVSEEGQFGVGHLLWAVNVPYSRLELLVEGFVPRLSCHVVLMDQNDGVAFLAARRLSELGYTAVSVLSGGVAAWREAGHELFHGVYVASKAFGEWVENASGTPAIEAAELYRLLGEHEDVTVLDPRTLPEHSARHIPEAVACPSAELIYRFYDLVPSPKTLVVVACGGRTRGIVGAQTLIDAAVPNPVVALEDGNHGWLLAGYTLETGLHRQFGAVSETAAYRAEVTAKSLALRFDIPVIDAEQAALWLRTDAMANRTTFVLDVRSPEEYASGHFAGARSAPGGQLIQATDRWIGTLGARVVLVDDDGVRAVQTAHWLQKLGWEVHTLRYQAVLNESPVLCEPQATTTISADKAARVEPQMSEGLRAAPEIKPLLALELIERGALVISLDRSDDFLTARPEQAHWATRSRLAAIIPQAKHAQSLVLFSRDARVAQLAAVDLSELLPGWIESGRIHVVEGGLEAWSAAGLPTVSTDCDSLRDEDRIDFLFWAHDRRRGNKDAMRTYLDWEKQLLAQAQRDHPGFPLFRGGAALVATHSHSSGEDTQ